MVFSEMKNANTFHLLGVLVLYNKTVIIGVVLSVSPEVF